VAENSANVADASALRLQEGIMAGQEFPSSIDRCLLTSAAAALTAASESAEAANHDFPPPSPEVQASNVSVQQRVAFWKSGSRVQRAQSGTRLCGVLRRPTPGVES
jgi:hypothetical protein